jgi:hypothetical protein
MQAKTFSYHLLTTTKVSLACNHGPPLADVADAEAPRRTADAD